MKKILSLFSAIIFLCFFASCSQKEAEQPIKSEPFTVNGETVTTEEIEYFKGRCKADIINEYAEKYSITDFSDFWDKDFDGKTPSQALEERADEQAIDAKIKLVMMRENGIYDDISFSAFKEKAQKYNEEHADSVGNVGINTIDLTTFYTYYISTGEMLLKTKLAEGELKPTEAELEEAAKENPEMNENGLVDIIVSQKYDKLVAETINNAEIK